MKRAGQLIEAIASRSNFMSGLWRAAKGRRRSSVVQRFRARREEEWSEFAIELRRGALTWGPYQRFVVHDPKRRVIHAAPFRDRVRHHALLNVCGPFFERRLIADTYACRQEKGQLAALRRAQRFASRGGFFLKLDIRRYFDSICHRRLKRSFRLLFRETALLATLDHVVSSYSVKRERGIPIGTLTSQVFANHYLGPLDRYVKEELKISRYVRYMDDMVLWDAEAERLEAAEAAIQHWLSEELSLEVKAGTRKGPVSDGVTYLGVRVLPGGLLASRESRRRLCNHLGRLDAAYVGGELSSEEVRLRLVGILGPFQEVRCRLWRRRVVAESSLGAEG